MVDAARHRQKREAATRLGKFLSAGMRVETCLGTFVLILCL